MKILMGAPKILHTRRGRSEKIVGLGGGARMVFNSTIYDLCASVISRGLQI